MNCACWYNYVMNSSLLKLVSVSQQCITFTSVIGNWPTKFSNVQFVFAQQDTVSDNFMHSADMCPINFQCQRTYHLHFCWQKSDCLVMIQCVAEIKSRKTKFGQTAVDLFRQREYCPPSHRPKCRLLKGCSIVSTIAQFLGAQCRGFCNVYHKFEL